MQMDDLATWLEGAWRRFSAKAGPSAPHQPPPAPPILSYADWCAAYRTRRDVPDGEIARINARRRTLASIDPMLAAQPVVGLSLSGGGIRSATFSLGLLREFGRLHLLHRFDYLSTVSGGSYTGSYYCGLFAERGGAAAVSEADFPDPFEAAPPGQRQKLGAASLAWLRQSGRYLTPHGSGDYWGALGLVVRNCLGVQIVIGSAVMTLALFAVGFRLLMDGAGWHHLLDGEPPPFFACAPLLVLLAAPVGCHIWCGWAYWLTRRGNATSNYSVAVLGSWVIALAALAAAWFYPVNALDGSLPSNGLRWVLFAIAASALGGLATLGLARRVVRRQNEARDRASSGPTKCYDSKDEIAWDECRNALTRPLRWCAFAFVLILVAGLADGIGFSIFASPAGQWKVLAGSPMVATIIVPIARSLLPKLAQLAGSRPAPANNTPGDGAAEPLLNSDLFYRVGAAIGALALIAAVALFWIMLAYKVSWPQSAPPQPPAAKEAPAAAPIAAGPFDPVPMLALPAPLLFPGAFTILDAPERTSAFAAPQVPGPPQPSAAKPITVRPWTRSEFLTRPKPADFWRVTVTVYLCWLAALLFLSFCIALTPTFINLSSLTSIYAARLRRAYLGAGNFNRIRPSSADVRNRALDVWDKGDDIRVADYFKEDDRAAPLHLINVTLNETRGEGSNIVQRDRHGRNLVISPTGIYWNDSDNLGICSLDYEDPDHEQLPLSTWVAISGAAFSTGMGSRTGFPLTQLAGLANVRLGYWWRRHNNSATRFRERWREFRKARKLGLRRSLFERYPTQYDLLREFRGDFPGPSEDYWYLSDGGHFENTGAYELIRRRLPFIVVSDNGQDARFEYEDLANLVRKARIDFNCEIDFLGTGELDRHLGHDPALREVFGTLSQISGQNPAAPNAVAALARLTYGEEASDVACSYGTLLLVKPRLTGDGPADLVRYKAANQAFPQQTTLDQFFDEAQWESYYHLGRLICRSIFDKTEATGQQDAGWRPFRLASLF